MSEPTSTRVYKYHLRPPVENVDEVRRQLALTQRYQHTLTTIERARRRAYVAARRRVVGDLEEAERLAEVARQWCAFGRAWISRRHTEQKSRKTSPEDRERIAALKAASQACYAAVKKLKTDARSNAELLAESAAIEARAKELRLAARAAYGASGFGLYWGSYQLVEQACDAARRSSTDPAFRPRVAHGYTRWDDPHVDGQLSVQITGGGMPAPAATECHDTRVRLAPMPRESWPSVRGATKGKEWRLLHLRIGSTPDRAPVWAVWPCRMHRPLPSNALVKRVTVTSKRRGFRTLWSVEVTLTLPSPQLTANPRILAVNPGWRQMKTGLRVAFLADDSGLEDEIWLDSGVVWLQNKERELRSLISEWRNLTLRYLQAWKNTGPRMPAWFADASKGIGLWRSEKRLTRLAERWRDNRFEGDECAFRVVWIWRERWRHLCQWANGCRRRSMARRREQYRILAARICREYGTIVFDDTSYPEVARKPSAERADTAAPDNARRNRCLAAPGDLRSTIEQAASARGVRVMRVHPANLTTTCHVHGATLDDAAKSSRVSLQYSCGCVRDQDANACHAMVAMVSSGEARDPAASKTRKRSRFDKTEPTADAAE